MFQIDTATAAAALAAPSAAGPNPGYYFTDGNPGTGTPATIVPAEWLNMVMMELINILLAAGIAPDKASRDQLSKAILLTGAHVLPIKPAYMAARKTNGCGPVELLETAGNKVNKPFRAFDPAVQEYAQFDLGLGKVWDALAVQYRYEWSHGAGASAFGVVCTLQGLCLGNGDAIDSAFGAGVDLADAGGAADTLYISPWSGDLTIADAAVDEAQTLQFTNKVGDAGWTLDTADFRLHTLFLRITLAKGNDA